MAPKVVALTFDDGPSELCTGAVLDILNAWDVRATFFMLGRHVEELSDVTKRVVGEGHTVGLHGYSHSGLRSAWDVHALWEEIDRSQEALWRTAGVETRLYRPPHGRAAPWIGPWLRRRGWRLVGWNISGRDWDGRDAEAISDAVVRRLRPGGIILLHDGDPDTPPSARQNTVRALPAILRGGSARGFRFVPLDATTGRPGMVDSSTC